MQVVPTLFGAACRLETEGLTVQSRPETTAEVQQAARCSGLVCGINAEKLFPSQVNIVYRNKTHDVIVGLRSHDDLISSNQPLNLKASVWLSVFHLISSTLAP